MRIRKYHRGGYVHEHPHGWREQIGDVSRALESGFSSIGRDIQDVVSQSILGEYLDIPPSTRFSEPPIVEQQVSPFGPDYPNDPAGLPSTWDSALMMTAFGDVVDTARGLAEIVQGAFQGDFKEGLQAGLPLILLTWAPMGTDKALLGKYFSKGEKSLSRDELREVPNALFRASDRFIRNAPKEEVDGAVSEMSRLVRQFDEPHFRAERQAVADAEKAGEIYVPNYKGPMYERNEALRYTGRAMDRFDRQYQEQVRESIEQRYLDNYRKQHPMVREDLTYNEMLHFMDPQQARQIQDQVRGEYEQFMFDESLNFKPFNPNDLRGYEAMEGTPSYAARQATIDHANADYGRAGRYITGSDGMQRYVEGSDLYRIGSKERPVSVIRADGEELVDWKDVQSGDIISLDQSERYLGDHNYEQRLVSTSQDGYLGTNSQAERPYFTITETEGLPATRPMSYGGGYHHEREVSLHPSQNYEVVAVRTPDPSQAQPRSDGSVFDRNTFTHEGVEYVLRPVPTDYRYGGKMRLKKNKKRGMRCVHSRK